MATGDPPLNALIVDDEQPARKRLRKLLQPLVADGSINLMGEAVDGLDALEKLSNRDVDLAFLDVQMPELSGFEVLERLDPDLRPIVVFTTAYDAYAIRAFDASAVDYLLKPISKDRLAEAVSRARRMRHGPATRSFKEARLERLFDWLETHEQSGESAATEEPREYLRQLSIPYRDRILLISVDRVLSAEINEGITRIFVLDDDRTSRPRIRQHVVNYTLDQLESNLPPERFMRVHRSAIVQLDQIQELVPWFSGRYKLILPGEHEVIASRERSKQLKDALMI